MQRSRKYELLLGEKIISGNRPQNDRNGRKQQIMILKVIIYFIIQENTGKDKYNEVRNGRYENM